MILEGDPSTAVPRLESPATQHVWRTTDNGQTGTGGITDTTGAPTIGSVEAGAPGVADDNVWTIQSANDAGRKRRRSASP